MGGIVRANPNPNPNPYHSTFTFTLTPTRRDLLVGGVAGAAVSTLNNLQMELRKTCNHPFLIKGVEDAKTTGMSAATRRETFLSASGKLVLLDKLLPKLRAEAHCVLIFSQFTMMLDLLADFLKERRFAFERLDGNTHMDARQAAIDRFSRGGSAAFIFLLSTRAGGVGINLVAADTVIIYDSDWNPQNDVQAMARAHRIGQTKTVKVFRLVTRNTYEQALVEIANRKLGLERALNGDGAGHEPTRDEVARLLKCGAQDIAVDDKDDAAFLSFSQADIEQILEGSTTVRHASTAVGGSVFSKATFAADEGEGGVELDDPEFWSKVLPQLQTPAAEDEPLGKRRAKQAVRWQHPNSLADDVSDDPDDAAYEPELHVHATGQGPAAHVHERESPAAQREREARLAAGTATENAEQARAHGLRVKDFIAVRSVLGSLVVQVERAARAQARVDEREERGAELTRVKEERLREQARLLAAYQVRARLEREQAARLQQQQRSVLVRDLEDELRMHERLQEAQARAAAGLP